MTADPVGAAAPLARGSATGPGLARATVSVTTRLDGSELRIPVHVVKGERDGPTLTLVSTQHGGEWLSIEIVRRVISELVPSALRGRVIGIPVANPIALEHFTRMTPDESDEPDLNRVWPGGKTWITEQIAAALDNEVLAGTDYLMDFHPGPWGTALATIGYGADLPDEKVRRSSLEMAIAFGHPSVRALKMMGAFPGPRSIAGYAGSVRKIPNIGPCLGGLGFGPEIEREWLDQSVRGVHNVLRHLGMVDGDPTGLPSRYFHFASRGHRVVPRKGGYLRAGRGPEALMTEVSKGTVLGTVTSPYTFERLEDLVAPADGVLFGVARDYMVRPGDWAYFIAESKHPDSAWVERTGSVKDTATSIERRSRPSAP
ncbi:MAG TPA: succinylglutamate desuccinylase/aspartoacylase family protein [Candidatus Limnocylindria bacterium]|nr:succinylglutamate desuccinylase/aspartoacylase family protein [Candidatus Limnocylindria bacterium]